MRRFRDGGEQLPEALAGRTRADEHLMTKLGRKKLPEIAADDVARLVADLHPAASPAWTITGALSTLSGCLPREAPRP